MDQPYAEQKQADDLEVINFAKNIIGKEELSIISSHDERWISTTKLPWYDERGNTIGLFGISRDITQRKAAETTRDQKDDLLNRSRQISQIILSKLDSNHIINALAKQIILGGIFRSLMIALVDDESQMVNVVGRFRNEGIAPSKDGLGDSKRMLRSYTDTDGLQYRLEDDNITAVTARTGTMQIIEEWDQRFDAKVNTPKERQGKVAYFIPIKQGKRVLAVLGTGSQIEDKERTLQQIDTMAPLWDQVAIALDHAQLYEILQQQITEREQIEKSLRESEERFRDLYHDAPVAYFSVKPNGHIHQANEQASILLGSEHESLVGTPVIDLYADTPNGKEKARRTFQHVINGEIIRNEELQMQHCDGRVIWVNLTVTPVRDEHGKIIESRSVAIDITDHQRMEEELRRIHNLESLGVLAGGIAHDFNNVLTGVIGSLALLERLTEADSEIQAIAKEGRQAADRTRDLTQQLLTFAKGGAPVREFAILEDLLRETAEMSLHGSNAKAHYDLAENLYSVEVDKGQMGQVIQNLVLNADQAMPEGGIISIAAKNEEIKAGDTLPLVPGNYVVVRIEDEGGGIPPSQL
ncbi:MAG: PAS domain S-box-containing protein [Candidatus Latescibacterota bacterium]